MKVTKSTKVLKPMRSQANRLSLQEAKEYERNRHGRRFSPPFPLFHPFLVSFGKNFAFSALQDTSGI